MAEIRLVNVRKAFKDVVAVRDVTIAFPTSTVTGLLGPSGCGKTTMMRIIAGLETPTAGDVYFDDERVTDLPPRKRNIGMVFQYPVVYQGISVYRNIELPLREDKELSETDRRQRVEEVISILGLEESAHKATSQLDMGTRQKVAVARAVARQPRIILFDEPITNVDVETKIQLKQALKKLSRQHQQTIIYVTHDQTEAMTLADQIALMQEGEIVQRDEPRKLYNYPNNVFGGWFLGNPGMNFFEQSLDVVNGSAQVTSPLFPTPVKIAASEAPLSAAQRVTLGIRPEQVQLGLQETPLSVRGRVLRKFIVVGGQYLVTIMLGDRRLKAKVDADRGRHIRDEVWVKCPFEWVTVFGADGNRLEATLSL
ncbi:ATP-binding cassette domain-containing protein [candidate division KSB3 bacterium]|uniref:ATP-binding cassette domain-containing protein n=1 Tax=candidate division KSB3 bacterium TaxID=2044937 RepID=A0A9D5JW57_9BACT|nr:ATP-binding cassette domain-containing protein [candidate division KSB3 bacterium]MBD3324806.1 ATP-binding cassette domain-containing protein [candidate division KSB3 bacterium]